MGKDWVRSLFAYEMQKTKMISITTSLQQFRQLPIIQMIMKLDTRVETIIHLVQTMVHLLLVDLLV